MVDGCNFGSLEPKIANKVINIFLIERGTHHEF